MIAPTASSLSKAVALNIGRGEWSLVFEFFTGRRYIESALLTYA